MNPEIVSGLLKTLRESWRNDGAEGESIHALCRLVEENTDVLYRLVEEKTERLNKATNLLKEAATWAKLAGRTAHMERINNFLNEEKVSK